MGKNEEQKEISKEDTTEEKTVSEIEAEKNDGYTKLESGDVITLKEGETIEGIFRGISESVLYPSSWAVSIEVNNEQKVIFVNNIVNDLFIKYDIKIGQKMKLKFKGMIQNKAKTFEYKDYDLFIKPL